MLKIFILVIGMGITGFPNDADAQSIGAHKDCFDCPDMIVIPKGSFLMGTNDGRLDEQPKHLVNIENIFAVGKYEVTRGQYAVFIDNSGYDPDPGCETWDLPSFNMDKLKSWSDPAFSQNPDHPVVCVNWHDAQAYVTWLREKTGGAYRLLSEAEWEYVARAGSTKDFGFGDEIDPSRANYGDQFRKTTTVGSYSENKFGLHDMHGNVAEWVADCWSENYQHTPRNSAFMTNGPCDKRSLRGGTWHNEAAFLRSAFRNGYFPSFRLSGIGFRVARDLN